MADRFASSVPVAHLAFWIHTYVCACICVGRLRMRRYLYGQQQRVHTLCWFLAELQFAYLNIINELETNQDRILRLLVERALVHPLVFGLRLFDGIYVCICRPGWAYWGIKMIEYLFAGLGTCTNIC